MIIKLNPIETLPDKAESGLNIAYTETDGRTNLAYVRRGHTLAKTSSHLISVGPALGRPIVKIKLSCILGWIDEDDLFAQFTAAHNVDITGAKIKNVEVSE